MTKPVKYIISLFLFLPLLVFSQKVYNIRFEQVGKQIHIYYDLSGEGTFNVKINFQNQLKMAIRTQFKMTTAERRHRHFSDSFKIQKVRELETGKTKVFELCKQYEVSDVAIYRWLNKFGIMKDKMIELAEETYGVDI